MSARKRLSCLFASALFLTLSACGGGGGTEPPPTGGNNRAPVADAGANQTVAAGDVVSLDASGSADADNDTLSYTWSHSGDIAIDLGNANSRNASFTAPDVESTAVLTLTVTVSDGTASDNDTVKITVMPGNHAPVASAGDDAAVTEGTSVILDASASSDADGDTLTYSWEQTGGPAATLNDASIAQPAFIAPDVAEASELTFVVTVDDGTNTSTDDVVITVEPILLDVAITETKTLTFTWNGIANAHHYRLLENPDGASGFAVLIDDIDAADEAVNLAVPVHLFDWLNVKFLLEACLDEACTELVDTNTLDMTDLIVTQAIGYIKASNTGANDYFGKAVALSGDGNTLAVGAWFEDSAATGINGDQNNNFAIDSGAVYVFVRNETGWAQQAYIKASNTGSNDQFGFVVALSDTGDTLAIGARGEDSTATGINGDQSSNGAPDSGAIYVFARAGTDWAQQAYIKASNTGGSDRFGGALALSGDGGTLAVGADLEDSAAIGINGDQTSNNMNNAGAAYVFIRTGTDWVQQAYVKASNTGNIDLFGNAIALSDNGNTLAVSATGEDSAATGFNGDQTNNDMNDAGAVYVFARTGTDWAQQAYIKASNAGIFDDFGAAVALSGNGDTLAVGARFEDSAATGINDDQTSNNMNNAGAAYVFIRTGTDWVQQAYVKASNTGGNDRFGVAVALSGNGDTLAVGADLEDSAAIGINGDHTSNDMFSAGAVYVFARNGAVWAQRAYVKATNPNVNDSFGEAVALSDDGGTLAVGVRFEDSAATGINAGQDNNDASGGGAVYVY